MSRKAGRNDPCPCGSGRKYKRCCLPDEDAARLAAARQDALLEIEADALDDQLDDDDGVDEFVDPEDPPPFDVSAIELIRYERGFVDRVDQLETGEWLRATEWRAPGIPQDLLDTLAREGVYELDGPWGDPAAADPVQVDVIHLQTADDDIVIEILNRAVLPQQAAVDVDSLHRVCGSLEAAADAGVEVLAGRDNRSNEAGAGGAPPFPLEDALKAHRKQRGTCALCGAEVTSPGATRHLAACAPRHDDTSGPFREFVHLRVTTPRPRGYWIDLEIRADQKLSVLDDVLRDLWVECCGHLSSFAIGGVDYASHPSDDPLGGLFGRRRKQRGMNTPIGKALSGAGARFTYEYDFGSTTRLQLIVRGARSGRIGRHAVQVLARNQPLAWPCRDCGAPAAWICTECDDNPFVCDAHAKRHPCDDDMLRQVVNSPRMGVCGYG